MKRIQIADIEKVVGGLRRKVELPPPEELSEEEKKMLEELQNIKV